VDSTELFRVLSPVVLFVAITGAIVKTSGMKGDLVQQWRQRVQLAEAGLSERAAAELRALQRNIQGLLGTGVPFKPGHVVADPGALLSSVHRFQYLIEVRDGLRSTYDLLLRLPRVFFWGLVAADAGVAMLFVRFSGLWPNWWLGWIGAAVFSVATVVLACVLWSYRRCQDKLADGDILSSPEEDNG
jgi:hypothetical protein